MRVYAIGDIHGEVRALDALHGRIAADAADALRRGVSCLIVYLGDYVDRGPDSRGVLDRLTGPAPEGMARRFLRGNHEAVMLNFLTEPAAVAEWLDFGGLETLQSYGVRVALGVGGAERIRQFGAALAERLPDAHRRFLASLEPMIVLGDYAFVHAGVLPGRPLDQQRVEDLLWIREPFLSSKAWHGRVVVHGHTVVDDPEVLENRINIDTGAYASGVLTALVLEGMEQRVLQIGPN